MNKKNTTVNTKIIPTFRKIPSNPNDKRIANSQYIANNTSGTIILNTKAANINENMKTNNKQSVIVEENIITDIPANQTSNFPVVNNKKVTSIAMIDKNGYIINKTKLDPKILAEIKSDLTVRPYVPDDPNTPTFEVFVENATEISIPRFYGIKKYGMPVKIDLPDNPSTMTFIGGMREPQLEIINKCLPTIKRDGGGMISIGCGGGKTVISLYIASHIFKCKTLVLVHKEFLQDQWIERAKQFTTAKIGIIRQNKIADDDCDIVIGMIQSISLRDYDENIFSRYGCLIIDECFPGNQNICTFDGKLSIETLYNMWERGAVDIPLIRSYSEKTKTFEYKKLTFAWKKYSNDLIKITVNNQDITSTSNHRYLTITGYKEASKLVIGDILIGSFGSNNRSYINNIVKLYNNDSIPVYDIEVEDNHNFIVCGHDNLMGPVVHNCHHYGSPVFSKALFKCGAKYVITLSATPMRADKLTKVINWHGGDILYRQKTKINKQVIAKVFKYTSTDSKFTEKKIWRAGRMQPSNVLMINELVQIDSRNEHIINILDELRKHPERKILVLSGRREHLTLLKDSIDEKIKNDNVTPKSNTSYYIGGMKKPDRKHAEDNGDILFGTYDMAHEGLDIDRLNTIILATPKKNIIQAVGRIMRRILKVGDIRPLIIDFYDELSIFRGQGNIRLAQYRESNYKIETFQLQNNNIVTFKELLKSDYNMNDAQIAEYMIKHKDELSEFDEYDGNYKSILNLQKVMDEDKIIGRNAEIIEVDPNDESDDSDDKPEPDAFDLEIVSDSSNTKVDCDDDEDKPKKPARKKMK